MNKNNNSRENKEYAQFINKGPVIIGVRIKLNKMQSLACQIGKDNATQCW